MNKNIEVATRALNLLAQGFETKNFAPYLEILTDDFVFWMPTGDLRGKNTGKELAVKNYKFIAEAPDTSIKFSAPYSVSSSESMVVFEFEDGGEIMGKPFSNRIAVSMEVRGDKIAEFREYVGDVDPELFAINDATGTSKTKPEQSKYLEKLTPENSLLVMVDYLTGFLPGIKTIDPEIYQKNVSALARLGQIFEKRMPTVVLGDEGGFRGEFFAPIKEFLPTATRIARHTPSAWHVPKFRDLLAEHNRPKIIMAGISLDNCVMQTALDVLRAGYEVYILPDVSGTDSLLVEQSSIARLTQAGAVITNWVSLASELMNDWETPEGKAVGELYQKYSRWGE